MISGTTRVAGVIGMPVRHSLSPVIMNTAFVALGLDWSYFAFEVTPDRVAAALDGMRALGLGGLSVTMPHKEAVADLVDRRSPDVEVLRAVNCVVAVDDGTLVGENTDGPGFVDALRDELGFDPSGCRAAVAGAGGAARAVVLALARAGAADIAVVNRTRSNAERCASLAPDVARVVDLDEVGSVLGSATLVVNATPVGMSGGDGVLDPDALGPGHTVVDLVYHPAMTPLLAAAEARGSRTANGLGMLVHQAAHAVRHWTGKTPPVAAMAEAARAALAGAQTH